MAYHGSALIPFFGGEMRPLFGLRREIDRLFDDMAGSTNARWSPAVDVRETDKSLAIDVELPGIKPENVEVNVEMACSRLQARSARSALTKRKTAITWSNAVTARSSAHSSCRRAWTSRRSKRRSTTAC